MRRPRLSIAIFSGVVVSILVVVLGLASGPTLGPGEISGTVKGENGRGLEGILVRLINTDQQVSVSVITQGGGRYHADSLLPGTYEVRAERRGFETSVKGGLKVDSPASVDLVLKKRQGPEDYIALEDMPGQFPEDPDRALVFDTCFQCHSMYIVVDKRSDRAGWDKIVRRMAPSRGRTEAEVQRLVNYMAKFFNNDRPRALPFRTEPEPPAQQAPVRAEKQQGAVKCLIDTVALRHANGKKDGVFFGAFCQFIGVNPGYFNTVLPIFPELITSGLSPATHDGAKTQPGRISRYKRFGKNNQFAAKRCRFPGKRDDLLQRLFKVENYRRCLDAGYLAFSALVHHHCSESINSRICSMSSSRTGLLNRCCAWMLPG